MVGVEQQHMVIRRQPQQRSPEQRPAREVEREHTLRGGQPAGFGLALLGSQRAEVHDGEVEVGGRVDDLDGLALVGSEGGAQ